MDGSARGRDKGEFASPRPHERPTLSTEHDPEHRPRRSREGGDPALTPPSLPQARLAATCNRGPPRTPDRGGSSTAADVGHDVDCGGECPSPLQAFPPDNPLPTHPAFEPVFFLCLGVEPAKPQQGQREHPYLESTQHRRWGFGLSFCGRGRRGRSHPIPWARLRNSWRG